MPKLLETPRDTPDLGGALARYLRAFDRCSPTRSLRTILSAVCRTAIGWACVTLAAHDLRAQFLEPDPAFKNKRIDVKRILREDKAIPPGEQQMFDDFFRLYLIPQFAAKENFATKKENSKPDPKPDDATAAHKPFVPSGLPKIRAETRTQYFTLAPGANGPPHQRANQVSLEKFKEILRIKAPADAPVEVQGQVAAIKVNVVLAIGEMNEQEAGNNLKPKPLPQALTALLVIFNAKSADGKTSGIIDSLRFAAVVGIQRHAESDSLAPEARNSIQQSMLAVVKQKQSPEGRLPDTHNALRRRAATTLGMLGDLGPKGAVAKTLDAVLSDPSEPPKVRAEVAAALGMFKATPDIGVDFKSLANQIGWLLIDVGRPETAAAADKDAAAAWRRFRSCLKDGLEGLSLAATVTEPNQRKFVETIVAKVKLLDKTIDNSKKIDNAALAKTVNEQIKELEAVLEPRAVAPKAPDVRPVAPALPVKPPGKEASAVVRKTTPPAAGRATRVDSVSVDKRSTDVKPGTAKGAQDIEPAADEEEKTAAP